MKTCLVPPHESKIIPFVTAGAVVSGALVAWGGGQAIAQDAAAGAGERIALHLGGGHSRDVKTNPLVIAAGEKAYWDATPGELTNVSTGNTLVGVFRESAASAAATAIFVHNLGDEPVGT